MGDVNFYVSQGVGYSRMAGGGFNGHAIRTKSSIDEYEKVLQKFSKGVKLDLKRDEKFAQCGKIEYTNY